MNKSFLNLTSLFALFLIFVTICPPAEAKKKKNSKIKVLVVDGQSKNHDHWKEWTPILLKHLYESRLFQVDVATSPMKGESLDKFNPKFRNYDVVVSLYDGDTWSGRIQRSLEKYLLTGGGFVVVHAANNAFPNWTEYNKMIGLGGWGDRTETAGPYLFIGEKGEIVIDTAPGNAGHHGPKHEYVVQTRATEHPIMAGLPSKWLHAEDELYDKLRGPAINMEILATSYSDEKYEGTNRHEPIIMTIKYGEGKVFHTVMGHSRQALSCVGFMTTFIRGCEWAADRKVTFEIPGDFPRENSISTRSY